MSLNQEQRALLAQLADELIPAGNGMPSASEAGVAGRWLDEVLTARPDLIAPLQDVLAKALGRSAADVIAQLRAHDSAGFDVLTEVVPGAYFLNPDVRQALGYAGQGSKPIDPRVDYMEDGLLESVMCRGPIYRPTPKND